MKKLFFILLPLIAMSSCSVEDDTVQVNYELAMVVGEELPEEFVLGKTYEIKVKYTLPTSCHTYIGLDAKRAGSSDEKRRQIYVAAVGQITKGNTCNGDTNGITGNSKFSILIDEEEDYTFYFWNAEDSEGEPVYNTVTVPVKSTETVN